MDIKLKYEEALRIVAARDKAYAEDMDRLITLLVKRPLQGSIYPYVQSNIGISACDHVIELYEKQVIKLAEEIVMNEAKKLILQESPGEE